jgi:hypothetical protein
MPDTEIRQLPDGRWAILSRRHSLNWPSHKALKFGEQMQITLAVPCHVLEAEVSTDQGTETYSFDL